MPLPPNSFAKQERLKSRKQIEQLFKNGNSLFLHPIKVSWKLEKNEVAGKSIQAGVSVSKRNFKKAVDRNRVKRLLRECYRLNKAALDLQMADAGTQLSVFFIYVDKSLPNFDELQKKMQQCLVRLGKKINEHEKLL